MKKQLLSLCLAALSLTAVAQTPSRISYQSVLRGTDGAAFVPTSGTVNLTFHLYEGTSGTYVYTQDVNNIAVSDYGVVNTEFGPNGTNISGTAVILSTLNWSTIGYELEVLAGSTSLGRKAFGTVPYALYANSAGATGQQVSITGDGVGGAYPNFTITDANTTYTAGAGIAIDANNQITNTAITPAGTIVAFGGTTAPAGWALCDGASYSTTGTYANLFAAIGSAFGGSGNNFNVPDFRGRFLRGVDGPDGSASDRDPNSGTRTAMSIGGLPGNSVGSIQADAFQGHRHNIQNYNVGGSPNQFLQYAANANPVSSTVSSLDPITDGTNGTPRISSETRPINAYVNYIIKL